MCEVADCSGWKKLVLAFSNISLISKVLTLCFLTAKVKNIC